jgi:hypothetical protein
MDRVHGKPRGERRFHRLGTDEVAAMDDRFRAQRARFAHRLRERIGAVVAVGNDADLHGLF